MRDLSELPEGWRVVKLGEAATLQRGMDLPKDDRIHGHVPVYGANGVHGFHNSAPIKGPGVITGRSGSVGEVHYSESSFWPLNTTLFVKNFHGNDERFIYYLLSSIRLERFSASTGVPSLNRNFVHPIPVALPPLTEQRAIIAVLDAIDEAIERTEAVISATERLRDALLNELLTRGVPGWHTQWRSVPGLGSIPADWQVVRLKEILVLDQPGAWGDEPTLDDPGVCVLRAADLTRDGHVVPDGAARRRLSKRDRLRRLMRDGDLMLERSGGGPGTPVGRVALIDGLGPIYCNNFCQHLRVDASRCNPDYAVRVLWHRYLRGITGRLEHRTTGIRNLDYAGYLAFPLPLPSLDEQDTIAKVLDRADGMHVQARAERDRLRALKASVTVVLLTGRVRVGQEQLCGLAFQS